MVGGLKHRQAADVTLGSLRPWSRRDVGNKCLMGAKLDLHKCFGSVAGVPGAGHAQAWTGALGSTGLAGGSMSAERDMVDGAD